MSNPNEVGKVFNLTGSGGGSGSIKLESLAVTKPPKKTIYKSGESFDPTGMVVEASYGFGLTSEVTGYTVTPSVLTDGVTEVTITLYHNVCDVISFIRCILGRKYKSKVFTVNVRLNRIGKSRNFF